MNFSTKDLLTLIEQTDLRYDLHQDQLDDLLLALDQKEQAKYKLEQQLVDKMLSYWQRHYDKQRP